MKLSERLDMIAQNVEKCDMLWDIGTDHAYIPIHLVMTGICKRAVASDVKPGPILIARKNIEKNGLINEIDTKVCYGLEETGWSDCIIIAGMGGILIKDIIEKDSSVAKKAKQIVLQPMTNHEVIRQYLFDEGYEIYKEDLTLEKGKVYNVICARYTGKKTTYMEYELYSSKYLVENRHPLINIFLKKKIKMLENMSKGKDKEKYTEIKNKLEEILIES